MSAALGTALLLPLGVAAWHDLRWRRIPNEATLAVVALWMAHALLGGAPRPGDALTAAAAILALGIVAWRLGWLGGGDVKLTAALGLWAGTEHALPLLLVVALAGGALAAAMLALRGRPRPQPAGEAPAPPSPATLPYGVAIAFGGAWLVHRLLLV